MFTSFKDHFEKTAYVSLRLSLSVTVVKHRITEWLRLEETSENHMVQTPAAQAGPPRNGFSAPCLSGF